MVNAHKCHFMSFCPWHSMHCMGLVTLLLTKEFDSTKDLGVCVDSSLQFKRQISFIVKKFLRILGLIKNVSRDFRSASTLVKLYKPLLLPILTYCLSIWLPHTQLAMGELISIEHKFLRFVSKLTPVQMHFFDHDYTSIRSYLNFMPLRLIFLRNIYYILPFYISHKFPRPHLSMNYSLIDH